MPKPIREEARASHHSTVAPAPLLASLVGVAVGSAVLALRSWDLRWILGITLVAIASVVGATLLRSLYALVVLLVVTMQIEVAIRPGHGHAATAGLQLYSTGILAALILLVLRYRRSPIRWSGYLHRPIALLFIMLLLAVIFSSERFAGLDFLLMQFQLFLIYVTAMSVIHSEADIKTLVTLLLDTLLTQGLVYFIQSALGMGFNITGDTWDLSEELPRPGGTVSANPAGFASYIIPLMFIAIAQLTTASSWRRPWTLVAVSVGLVALLLTFTRAAWAGFLIGSMYLILFGIRYTRMALRTVALIVSAAVIAAIALAPLIHLRLSEPVGAAYDERAGLMQIALNIIASHPLFGVGPGAYGYVFKNYLPSGMDQWLYTVHNEYLLRAAESGILGGAAWVWLLFAAYRQSRLLLTKSASAEMRTLALAWGAGLLNLAWQMYWVPWRGFGYNALLWFMLGVIEAAAICEWGPPNPAGGRGTNALRRLRQPTLT